MPGFDIENNAGSGLEEMARVAEAGATKGVSFSPTLLCQAWPRAPAAAPKGGAGVDLKLGSGRPSAQQTAAPAARGNPEPGFVIRLHVEAALGTRGPRTGTREFRTLRGSPPSLQFAGHRQLGTTLWADDPLSLLPRALAK